MTLLRRKKVLAAKIETTPGTAVSLSTADALFNVYNPIIQPTISMSEREGQGGFGMLASVPDGYGGTATFRTDIGWDGTGVPGWASTFLPACGFVATGGVLNPKTEAPGSSVKTLTIGCYIDGTFKSIRGAAGTAKIVFPTGKLAYIEWTFTGVWVGNSAATIIDPTYPLTDYPLRAAGGATTYNSVSICSDNITFDLGNTVVLRECGTTLAGYESAIITNRNPKITAKPEAKLVATRNSYADWLAIAEAVFTSTIASVTGDGSFTIAAPKAQIINNQEGDRNGLVTDDLEWQCNRNGNTEDRELSLTFTDDT